VINESLPKPQLAPRDKCTGCSACANGCPKRAIHMLPDREGFLYPTVTDACVACGHCTHICPVLKHREPRSAPAVFAVWNPDEAARRDSTSGGVFSLLAEGILESGGVVVGAAMDDSLHLRHIAVEKKEQLPSLRGAKYVQSEIGDIYRRVQMYLAENRQVLFSGTPCQVDGLYYFLGEHPENLLTCDLLCGGVPSPGVWEHMVDSIAYIKKKQPAAVNFRDKAYGWKEPHFSVTFADGSAFSAPLFKSEYGRGLSRSLFLRPACHSCQYTSTDRPGDVSLGDFWNLPKDFHPEEQKKGISLLLINTEKGAHAFDMLPVKKERRTLEEAVANPALRLPVDAPQERTAFFCTYAQQPFQTVRNRFLVPPQLSYQMSKQVRPGGKSRLAELLRRKKGKK